MMMVKNVFTYSTAAVVHQEPAILPGHEDINGHKDEDLFTGDVINFHNQLGSMFTWFQDGNPLFNYSHNKSLIKIKEPGT